jgi:hypothetical protein
MALHKVVEKLINIRKRGVMTMKQYKYVTSIRECVELTEECGCDFPPKNEKEWKEYAQKRAEEWRIKLLKVDEGKEADYGYDYQKSVQTVKALAGKKPVDMKSLAARMQASYAKDEKKPVKEGVLDTVKKAWKAVSNFDDANPKYDGNTRRRQALRDKLKSKPVKEDTLEEAGNKPLEPHVGMGDSRTPRELKTQMSGASTEFVKSTASKKPGMFHSKVAHMQSKLAKSELRKRTNEESLDEGNGYDDNRTGFAKKPREDDEGHAPTKFKAKSTMDRPHTVHIDGKPWKKFSNGNQANAAVKTLAAKGKKATAIAHFKENTLDSMAATQAPNDGANSPDTTIPAGKKLIRMSKSAQIIKSAYKKGMKEEVLDETWKYHTYKDNESARAAVKTHHAFRDEKGMASGNPARAMGNGKVAYKGEFKGPKPLKEDLYDHEKEDKSVSGLKKPKVSQPTEKAAFGETPKAAIVMSGGKTMTGEPRDTIEIDPAMKGKPGGPNDPTVKK